MRALPAVVTMTLALAGCSSAAAADVRTGDCLQVGGPPDRPETARVKCGSPESNFRVVDWVVGGCMSVDPENGRDPVRVDCGDRSASNRQRATAIMQDVANVDQCATGMGYAYDVREFTVCVEGVS